jgi:hypothetical protein
LAVTGVSALYYRCTVLVGIHACAEESSSSCDDESEDGGVGCEVLDEPEEVRLPFFGRLMIGLTFTPEW